MANKKIGRYEFCKICSSLIVGESCTNKKCEKHVSSTQKITFKQKEYIQDLMKNLDIDEDKYAFGSMTKKEASMLVKKLAAEVEIKELCGEE
jgi:hypothetical protein